MVFNLTHSQIILQYKENGGRIEPYTIVIMVVTIEQFYYLMLAYYRFIIVSFCNYYDDILVNF
jgi:hypothetical protein